MAIKIPAYNNIPAHKLPPYQLFKRWQKATKTKNMDKFGTMSRSRLLADIKRYKPELLKPIPLLLKITLKKMK